MRTPDQTARDDRGASGASGADGSGSPLRPSWSSGDRYIPRHVVQPLNRFLATEVASGVLLLVAALVALVWANSPAASSYTALWETEIGVDVGAFRIAEPLSAWVNDLLMAFFFFVVGLEVKREVVHGSLRDPAAAALPIVCALGGMIAPALIYAAWNAGTPEISGWGIPMATDIAFSVGVLSLVGSRAPTGLKIFLLSLAVADDIGAILVIAVFYTAGLEGSWLVVAAATIVAVVVMKRVGVRALVPYVAAAAVLWFAVFESGVHATIAGVVLGLLTPARSYHPPEAVVGDAARHLGAVRRRPADGRSDEEEETALLHVSAVVEEAVSPLARLERALHPWTSFVVLPLFALANAGVVLSGTGVGDLLRDPVAVGVATGLVLGKPVGIVGAALLAVRLGRLRLPPGVGWLEMAGVALLAGIGFTVSIFVAGLAFGDESAATDTAKIGILVASAVAGVLGAGFLAVRDAAAHGRAGPG